MEWLPFIPSELHAAVRAAPGRTPTRWGPEEPTAIDVSLVRIAYEVLAAETGCSRCGAALGRRLRVEVWPTILRSVQWRVEVRTRCQGRRQHRHRAVVGRSSGDLVLGAFRAG